MPLKKREKYARREDAILHALELEKQLLKVDGKYDGDSDGPSFSLKKGLLEPSVVLDPENGNDYVGNSLSLEYPVVI